VRGEGEIDNAVNQDQAGSLELPQGIKGNVPITDRRAKEFKLSDE
jgi:hypothetical protein